MNKTCLLEFSDDSAGLGDFIVMMPYVEKFRIAQKCNIIVFIRKKGWISLFLKSYPDIRFVDNLDGVIFDKIIHLKHNNHTASLQRIFAQQLGFFNAEYIRPKVDLNHSERKIKNKYVCISTHSTSQLKFWNHPDGIKDHTLSTNWNVLCQLLRKKGYTPVCIDYHESFGKPPFYNEIPYKAVKRTGLSLTEVIDYLENCEFYVGLSSGLTWLAHAVGKPVCMISNFTEDWYEIDINLDDYIRITNKNVCHGCWNLVGKDYVFEYEDWYWCPRHKDTDRQFECHKSITPDDVYNQLEKWMK